MEPGNLMKEYMEKEWSMAVLPTASAEEITAALASRINELIQHDFHRLVSLLYRIDISEKKIRQLLEKNNESDAGRIIAGLFIERQLQKIESRKKYSQKPTDSEEEKW
jgi:hypothetical protein